jgi:hypothetical protein
MDIVTYNILTYIVNPPFLDGYAIPFIHLNA